MELKDLHKRLRGLIKRVNESNPEMGLIIASGYGESTVSVLGNHSFLDFELTSTHVEVILNMSHAGRRSLVIRPTLANWENISDGQLERVVAYSFEHAAKLRDAADAFAASIAGVIAPKELDLVAFANEVVSGLPKKVEVTGMQVDDSNSKIIISYRVPTADGSALGKWKVIVEVKDGDTFIATVPDVRHNAFCASYRPMGKASLGDIVKATIAAMSKS